VGYSQGEGSTNPHELGNDVPLRELPNIMRALGYYPTEKDVDDLINEVMLLNQGKESSHVQFDDLIKCK
jgi:hypothetical protein